MAKQKVANCSVCNKFISLKGTSYYHYFDIGKGGSVTNGSEKHIHKDCWNELDFEEQMTTINQALTTGTLPITSLFHKLTSKYKELYRYAMKSAEEKQRLEEENNIYKSLMKWHKIENELPNTEISVQVYLTLKNVDTVINAIFDCSSKRFIYSDGDIRIEAGKISGDVIHKDIITAWAYRIVPKTFNEICYNINKIL